MSPPTALTPEEQTAYHDAFAHLMESTYAPLHHLAAICAIIRRLDARVGELEVQDTAISEARLQMERKLEQTLTAERTRYVMADAGWREMNRQNEILRTDLAHARAEIDKLAPTVLALDEEQMRLKAREARLREALDAADRFGREVTSRVLIPKDGVCAGCWFEVPPSIHAPSCWLRPLLTAVRETFAVALAEPPG